MNQGTIIADQTTALKIDPNASGFMNQGMLRAMGELELSVPANALPPRLKRHFLEDLLAASVKEATLAASGGFAASPSAVPAFAAPGTTPGVERSAGLFDVNNASEGERIEPLCGNAAGCIASTRTGLSMMPKAMW